ncbi:hypothetical protein [Lysobacter sp. GCM10012299]|uniref:hypothetical protein n=1 Tax=Lysobacter sp. GCM10012299 TaxID=3317333 RepID=UPI0036190C3B
MRVLKTGTVLATDVFHFTGGIIGRPLVAGGIVIGPIGGPTGPQYIGPMSFAEACVAASDAGSYFMGTNQIHANDGPERSEFWYPNLGSEGAQRQSSDTWSAIAYTASTAGDSVSSELARYLAMSMRCAGWRLREVSRLHNEQLEWALISGRKSGSRFSNIAIFELHLAIHSLLGELCAARDYLAHIAAIRVGAKAGTDCLAWLQRWLAKPANAQALDDPLITLLREASGDAASPGWLMDLGELRNRVTHRQPMAANPDVTALWLREIATRKGMMATIRLAPSRSASEEVREDPSVSVLRFWLAMEAMCRRAATHMAYEPSIPHFIAE